MLPTSETGRAQFVQADSTSNLIGVSSKKFRKLYQQFSSSGKLKKSLITIAATFVISASIITIITKVVLKCESNICTSTECIFSAARLLEGMNLSVDPCNDFYDYVCGRWSTEHANPFDEANSWFLERSKILNNKIKDIFEQPLQATDLQPIRMMKNFHQLCMDTKNLDRKGLRPMFEILDLLELPHEIPDESSAATLNMARTLSRAQRLLNFDLLVQLSTRFNSSTTTTLLSIGPAKNTVSFANQRKRIQSPDQVYVSTEEYLVHQVSYMTAVILEVSNGSLDANYITREALKIIFLELQLKLSYEETDSEQEEFMTVIELQQLMFSKIPDSNFSLFNWSDYIRVLTDNLNVTLDLNSTVYVKNPAYFQVLGSHLLTLNIVNFHRFIWWKIIEAVAPHTTDVMRMHEYMFNQHVLNGISQPQSRSELCTDLSKSVFNEVISYLLVSNQNISAITKNVNDMMANIKNVFRRMIMRATTWIDEHTKNINIAKLDAVRISIGYPQHKLNLNWIIQHYERVKLVKNDFLGSLVRLKSNFVDQALITVHTSRRPELEDQNWSIDTTEVNAYYSRDTNSIAIPPAILQFPFYVDGIEALNYGAMGSILGHELTHGFDNEGKNYDYDGNKISTWNESTILAFNNRSRCFIEQYSNYSILDNITVDGNATLAENIADNGGIKEAYYAYQEFLSRNGKERLLPGFESFSHQQLLFISYANIWCKKQSRNTNKLSLLDEHSPNKFRVIGSLSNMDEFSRTWNCDKNSQMNRKEKCLIW